MKVINVNASRKYQVVIQDDFSGLKERVAEVFKGKLAVVYDDNTQRLFSDQIKTALSGFELCEITFPHGENTKSLENFGRLLSFLAQNGFTRKDGILAVGGGVIGDLCGFVASSYMRGITYISCPTTLLSMVDSSVGGKTAVNLPQGKNLVGAFYQPSLVYVAISCLNSLPQREIECGMGEVVKYAFLDCSLKKEDIIRRDYQDIIYKCLQIKRKFVEEDEFDKGERAKLNLGHTIGHAVESLEDFNYSHGLCVFNGIDHIIDLSVDFYGYNEEKRQELLSLLNAYPYTKIKRRTASELIEKIKVDKKAESDLINIVLIKEIGNTQVVKIPLQKLKESL
ncbi:MAG: 3-dehydroquinate synthase [Clostridia bacterium]|nr:3-dehydroquinate synthase [Clostridia bacterium]